MLVFLIIPRLWLAQMLTEHTRKCSAVCSRGGKGLGGGSAGQRGSTQFNRGAGEAFGTPPAGGAAGNGAGGRVRSDPNDLGIPANERGSIHDTRRSGGGSLFELLTSVVAKW